VQDIFLSETAALADVVLPAASFAEKDGTFTNTERRVQLVNEAVPPPGDARRMPIAWDGLIPALQENKIDAIMNSMSATEERKKVVDYLAAARAAAARRAAGAP